MPMKLLHRLSNASMPIEVTESGDVYDLRILRAAGHVYASIPLPHYERDGHWHQPPATVHRVTALGYKVLRYFGPYDNDQPFEKDHDK